MLEIAGGILIAVAALAVLVVTFRYIVLALSAAFCLAITAAVWLLLASTVGQWWATAALVAGCAISFFTANRDSPVEELPNASSAKRGKEFGQKNS